MLDSKMRENVEVEFLDDLDSMMEDIEDRLKITRMVSDSVIKGVVTAVQQDTNEKLITKQLELDNLKTSTLHFKGYASFDNARVTHDKIKDSVSDEFKKLRKHVEGLRGGKIKRNGSCHEMVGLGGILNEECDVEKTVDKLEMMMNDMSKLVDTVFITSDIPFGERKRENESKEVEDSNHHEFQEAGSQNFNLTDKFSGISDLLNELESLRKLLPSSDSGNLISHGSLDVDNIHGNPLRTQLSSRWEENGKSNKSKPDVPDSFDSKLSHMNKDDLIKHFNNLILNLKREHEAEVHELGDKYINLKGKYLSERRSFVLPTKDFEVLKRKIPEVVSKLDDILSESVEFIKNGDSVSSLNTLASENRHLRDLLAAKKDEVKHLLSQSVGFENHSSFMSDAFVEASIVEGIYKCVIQELKYQIQDMKEESELQIMAMQDIYEVLLENTSISAIEDTSMESKFMQEMLETVFQETVIDIEQKFESLYKLHIRTSEDLVSIQKKAAKLEAELILENEEKEKLKNEVHMLRNLVEEREKLATDELNNLKKQASSQETVILKINEELNMMNDKLLKAQEKLVSDGMEIESLNQKLELATEEIKSSSVYKNMVLALSEEKQSFVSLIELKEKEHKKQMEAVVVLVDELSTNFSDFECMVTMDVENYNRRLKNSSSQLSSLIKAANKIKSTRIQYKQMLERKCSDLKMAENEVDLLGDEVDTLFGLLEKIYIALDHYSPVLRHYPGVTDILKLVRRELSGESLKGH